MKENFIADLNIGQRITDFFALRKKELRHFEGKPYLKLELGDRTGRMGAVLWDGAVEINREVVEGDAVKVQGVVVEYRGAPQLTVEKLRRAKEGEFSVTDFLPLGDTDPHELLTRYHELSKSIQQPRLKELLSSFTDDEKFMEKFMHMPGGKLWHHAYLGGLLEHTLGVASLCQYAAKIYPQVDGDLLLAGALLHDVGKIQEFETTTYIDYTDEGRLWGHIVIGHQMVREKVSSLGDFPGELAKKLLHLVLSHHGKLKYGSPIVPQTLEAVILYYADELDAKVGAFTRIIRRQKEPHRRWSQWINLIDRYIYFGGDEDVTDSSEPLVSL